MGTRSFIAMKTHDGFNLLAPSKDRILTQTDSHRNALANRLLKPHMSGSELHFVVRAELRLARANRRPPATQARATAPRAKDEGSGAAATFTAKAGRVAGAIPTPVWKTSPFAPVVLKFHVPNALDAVAISTQYLVPETREGWSSELTVSGE